MCIDAGVPPESIRRVTRAVLSGGAHAVDGERAFTAAARGSDERGEALVTVTEVRVVTASMGRGTARRASDMGGSIVHAMYRERRARRWTGTTPSCRRRAAAAAVAVDVGPDPARALALEDSPALAAEAAAAARPYLPRTRVYMARVADIQR